MPTYTRDGSCCCGDCCDEIQLCDNTDQPSVVVTKLSGDCQCCEQGDIDATVPFSDWVFPPLEPGFDECSVASWSTLLLEEDCIINIDPGTGQETFGFIGIQVGCAEPGSGGKWRVDLDMYANNGICEVTFYRKSFVTDDLTLNPNTCFFEGTLTATLDEDPSTGSQGGGTCEIQLEFNP